MKKVADTFPLTYI